MRQSGRAVLFVFCLALWLCFSMEAQVQGIDRAQALSLEQSGQIPAAEEMWRALAEADRKNPEPPAHLGLLEARQERYAEAVVFYRQALTLQPAYPGVQMNLGLASFKGGMFPDALRAFRAELKLHPGDTRTLLLLGMTHFGMGDYLVATPFLKQAAARDPQSLPLRLTLAQSCLWSKQYVCVMDVYKEMVVLNVESAEVDMLAGEALDETGDSAGAIKEFEAAVRANTLQPNVHFGLGYLLWKESHFVEAEREFRAELENDASYEMARAYLGDTLCELKQFDAAKGELERAAAAETGSAMLHRDLGAVYASLGRNMDAERELQRAIDLDPADATPHWRLARLYQALGDKEQAAAEFGIASRMKRQENQALTDRMNAARP